MEGKVAVFGDADFVMAFSALGLDTYAVETGPSHTETVLETAKKILSEKYALIVAAENVARIAQEPLDATLRKASPCVIVVPTGDQSTGFATQGLGRLLKLATGINILGDN